MNCLDWKDPDIFNQVIEEAIGSEFYAKVQPNGVRAIIEYTICGDDDDGDDIYHLITHNYRAYEPTPFNSLDELKEFYVRALQEHVNNPPDEVRKAVTEINSTRDEQNAH